MLSKSLKIALISLSLLSLEAISATTYRVKGGDTLTSISKQYDVSVERLMEINNIKAMNSIKVGDLLIINDSVAVSYAGKTTSYTVQSGDTFSQIVRKFDTTTSILAELNPSLQGDFNQIYVGQKLIVPQGGSPVNIIPTSPANVQNTSNQVTNITQPETTKRFTGKSSLYTVRANDTLVKIANKFNVKAIDLARMNNFDATYKVKIGETIHIPEVESVRNTNNTPSTGPAGKKAVSITNTTQSKTDTSTSSDSFQHTVKAGETLLGLAIKNKVGLSALAKANGLSPQSRLKIGQKLIIPVAK